MSVLAPSDVTIRHRIRVLGVVQGVGFRPFVHRLATELDLGGQVGNDSEGVFVEVEGRPSDIERFRRRLIEDAPPLAHIHQVHAVAVPPVGDRAFRIVESAGGAGRTFISPDIAVCDDCLAELADPGDRRYRYPFVNCTNCGPRFTITIKLPYDRPNTTMAGFPLCPDCEREYRDIGDRRFHAQPIACPVCGPQVHFEGEAGTITESDTAISAAQAALAAGQVVAIKGIGGYHLACDATSSDATGVLRRRKHRADKPFAVMVAGLDAAAALAVVGADEAARLRSPARPIVLVRQRGHTTLSDLVAPGNPDVGLLLPYTPLHHLLFRPVPGVDAPVVGALVMTSGNLTDEPICFDDADARRRLDQIADAWLTHDRPIHVPCDDSVVRLDAGEELPIRRSRGYAPLPVPLPFPSPPLMAVGGELKNTFCLSSGGDAWMSQHLGDMGSVETLAAFERSAGQFTSIYQVEPESTVADAHPGYHTRQWAEAQPGQRATLVQHHHAHIAAVMAEHGVAADETVIGYAFDGTGFGPDGAIWGGEILLAGYASFTRRAHLKYVPLPGGDAAIHKPYRVALAHLWAAGMAWAPDLAPVAVASSPERAVIERQLERGVQCVATSSMGRLFDAVSSLLGYRHTATYEAQAAIELEAAAADHRGPASDYRFVLVGEDADPAPMLRAMVRDLRAGQAPSAVALGFHIAVAELIAETADHLRDETGIQRVALSGGVFQNVLLLRLARAALARRDLPVLTHRIIPPNDGGLALGQAAVAACTTPNRRAT